MHRSALPGVPARALAAGAAVIVLATSCGGASGGSASASGTEAMQRPATATARGATLRISGFSFGPQLTVSPRERITVINADSTTHTVTADRGNAFDVSVAGGGTTTMGAPTTAGRYPFHCRIHPFMKGVLIVR